MKNSKEILSFGKRFKLLRNAAGISQQQLAFDADIGLRTIQRIEAGEHAISIDLLFAIAKALNIHPSIFFEDMELNLPKRLPKKS